MPFLIKPNLALENSTFQIVGGRTQFYQSSPARFSQRPSIDTPPPSTCYSYRTPRDRPTLRGVAELVPGLLFLLRHLFDWPDDSMTAIADNTMVALSLTMWRFSGSNSLTRSIR